MEKQQVSKKQVSMSFVARIWLEPGTNGDPIWRGQVLHVQSNEEAYFQDLGALNKFLERVSGMPGIRVTSRHLDDADTTNPG
jgi:hypothetical protein